ncbi:MAG: ParA family protein [Spirochaetales bacterium]|nr:ParA family protein [Leptospiraceae bacterium]MCP5483113.1 ParA family protein [Spirochaetales bacterium]MCP5484553.1 ParA family protein [Spirochaetales bacterium]
MQKIIALANQKGGVGKTTTAVNLGGYLSGLGIKVLLIDIDPQGNASSGLGIDVHDLDKTIYEVLLGEISLSEAILPTAYQNLWVLPANVQLSGVEVDMLQLDQREYILREAMVQVRDTYDLILIDCPPNLGILTLNALCAANRVLITLQTEYYALEGLTQLMKVIQLVQQSLNPELILDGVVLTMFDQRTTLAQQVVTDVREHFGAKVYGSVIPRNVKLSEAPSFGKFIGDYAPDSAGARAYADLAREVKDRG